MCVNLLVGLLPYFMTNTGISQVLDEPYSETIGELPGMLVHYFQIILNFLYVCQCVGWLSSLLKLNKYRDISSSGWYIFLKNFGRIPKMLLYFFHVIVNFQYVYHSVSCITFLLLWYNYRYISSSVWKIFLSFFKDILGMLVQKFKIILSFFYVCQCVIWLTSLLKLDT